MAGVPPAPPCTGVILAGGLSSRFEGAHKGLERVGGIRIIDRVATALTGATDELLLVANDPTAAEWLPSVPVVPDVYHSVGSLGGLHAALVHAQRPIVAVAWDMPFVTAALLQRLRALGVGVDAVVPWSTSWRGVEPLCAWYSPACLSAIAQRLAAGDRRAVAFLDDVRVTVLPQDEVCALGVPEVLFMSVNTREDLAHARAVALGETTPGG